MLRLLSLLSLLAVATAPCALRAQESDDGVPVLGPRFLLATRAARRVPVDVARSPVLSQRISLDLEGVTLEEALRVVHQIKRANRRERPKSQSTKIR